MRFSSRLPSHLEPNALTRLLGRLRAEGVSILDLTESNPTRAGIEYPGEILAPLAAADSLRYEPEPFGLPRAREAVSRDFMRRGLPIPPARVVLTASTSEAYSLLFKLLCDPGDRVLVPVPSYPLFEYLTRLDGVEAAPYPLHYDGRWSVDLDALGATLTPRTRALLVVNPNNPTGSYVSGSELRALRELCRAHGLALIGDEVFGDYAFGPARATSVLETEDVLAFGLGGLSKSAGLPQLKLAWIGIAGPDRDVARALDGLEVVCDAYLSVSTPVQHAAGALLAAGDRIRAAILARVRENLAALRTLAARCPSVEVLNCEAGWSAILRVPRIAPEEDLVKTLLAEHYVLVHPGYFFDFPHEAFLVVSLLPPPGVFQPAVERVLSVAACR